jgi:hypothetical protein
MDPLAFDRQRRREVPTEDGRGMLDTTDPRVVAAVENFAGAFDRQRRRDFARTAWVCAAFGMGLLAMAAWLLSGQ